MLYNNLKMLVILRKFLRSMNNKAKKIKKLEVKIFI